MASIAPMISPILADALRMPSIVTTTSCITRPPSAATSALRRATFEASSVWAEVACTVMPICTIEADERSRLPAD